MPSTSSQQASTSSHPRKRIIIQLNPRIPNRVLSKLINGHRRPRRRCGRAMHRGFVDLRSSRPDGLMRQQRRRSPIFLWRRRPYCQCLYLQPPNLKHNLPTNLCIELAAEALDPSFVCNIGIEDLSDPLRKLLIFLLRGGVCGGCWDVEGAVRWIRCFLYTSVRYYES